MEKTMKTLLVMDLKNYDDSMPVDERYCVRAVIVKNGKIAVQQSRYGECKILGGGIEAGEDPMLALKREAEEESGLVIKTDSVKPLGEILEKRRDRFDASRVYFNHTWFYLCEVEDHMTTTRMTESELAGGFHLVWATPEEISEFNGRFLAKPWILRDTRFIQMFEKEYPELFR